LFDFLPISLQLQQTLISKDADLEKALRSIVQVKAEAQTQRDAMQAQAQKSAQVILCLKLSNS
jgi:predicted RNA-binding protein associated with RNAse of E/G family